MRQKFNANAYGVFILFTAVIFSVITLSSLGLSALIIAINAAVAQAQGQPDFVQNLDNKIQQESQAGLLTQQQAAKLQKKEAEIRRSIQKGLQKHGGRLSNDEMHSLAKKAEALNRSINKEVHKKNQDAVGVIMYQSADQGSSGSQSSGYTNNPNPQVPLKGKHHAHGSQQPMPPSWQNNTNN